MTGPPPTSRTRQGYARLAIAGAVALLLAMGIGVAIRPRVPDAERASAGDRTGPTEMRGWPPGPAADARSFDLPPPPSAGWEEAAETLVTDARWLLLGRARLGAFAEAQAEAGREDLALYPPPRDRLYRALMGSEQERTWALAALAARPEPDDALVRLVLRSQHPEDDEVVRLLGAELVAGLPPEVLSRHEEDLLRAFEREENPLVLALALPALEQMEEGRLRALVTAQLELASPSMLPVLIGLARDRLGPEAIADTVIYGELSGE